MNVRQSLLRVEFIGRFLFALMIEGVLAIGLVFAVYLGWSLSFDLRQVGHIPERCWIYDVDGNVYSRLYGENRILVNVNQISPMFKKRCWRGKIPGFTNIMGSTWWAYHGHSRAT